MLERQTSLPLSAHDELYEKLIPEDHFLRQMKELVDFSFIEEELKDKYCLDNGRNAEPPVRMFSMIRFIILLHPNHFHMHFNYKFTSIYH